LGEDNPGAPGVGECYYTNNSKIYLVGTSGILGKMVSMLSKSYPQWCYERGIIIFNLQIRKPRKIIMITNSHMFYHSWNWRTIFWTALCMCEHSLWNSSHYCPDFENDQARSSLWKSPSDVSLSFCTIVSLGKPSTSFPPTLLPPASRIHSYIQVRICTNNSVLPYRATLKNGKEICLDPEAPAVKKMIRNALGGH
jgi:hypothetical protein